MDEDPHIRVSTENWRRLNAQKAPGDTFDDVIGRLLDAQGESPYP